MLLIRRCEEQLAQVAPARARPRGVPHLRRPGGDRGRRVRPPAAATTWSSARTAATATRWPRACRRVQLIAELFGRATGCSHGRGGSMHLFSPEVGMMGTSGIVGPCILQAAGAGYSFKLLKTDNVAVAFFGDGAVNNGGLPRGAEPRRHLEAAGAVRVREQPVRHRGAVQLRRRQPRASPSRGAAYGMPGHRTRRQRRAGDPRGRRRGGARGPGPATGRRCSSARRTAPGRTPRAWATSPTAPARRSRSGRRAARSRGSATARWLDGIARPPSSTRIDAEIAARGRGRAPAPRRRAPGPTRRRRPLTSTPSRATPPPPPADRASREIDASRRRRSKRWPRRWPRTRASSSSAKASASAAATSRRPPGCTSSTAPSGCATRRSASAASSAWPAARR